MRDGFRLSGSFVRVIFLFLAFVGASSQMGSNLAPAPTPESSACFLQDSCTLLMFKSLLPNQGPDLQSWMNENVTEWLGVTWTIGKDGALHVEKLELRNLNLQGGLYPLLTEGLTSLTTLSIIGCNITSGLSSHLRVCPALEVLDLSNNNLHGSLPSVFSCEDAGNTSTTPAPLNLRIFNVSGNFLTGEIPHSLIESLTMAQNLSSLVLEHNLMMGNIPPALGNLTSLVEVRLAVNNLTDDIPFAALGRLPNLETLDVHRNMLSGTLNAPFGVGIFSNLATLQLSSNQLEGSIPDWVGSLPKLTALNLSANSFRGPIPDWLGSLFSLRSMDLSCNNFSGSIPESLGNLSDLQFLDLHYNNLSGLIPESLGNLSDLQSLELNANKLAGEVPQSLGNLSALKVLDLARNNINGHIPDSLGRLSNLTSLDLSVNNLTGSIPGSIGNMMKLEILQLQNNNLSNAVPSSLGLMPNLTSVNLSCNRLNGSFPDFSQLKNIETVKLSWNRFSGSFVQQFTNCTSLRSLWLGQNPVGGVIPTELRFLTNLVVLSLTDCLLDGPIPVELSVLTSLAALDLSYNKLTDLIPGELCELYDLQVLLLNNNQFTGTIPGCIGNYTKLRWFDLSFNRLIGWIPPDLANYSSSGTTMTPEALSTSTISNSVGSLVYEFSQSPTVFALCHNMLTGEIPPAFGHIKGLQNLKLNNNSLSGNIPDALGQASELLMLDLSFNQLDGTIPSSLTGLSFLSFLNLSFNNLSGLIPDKSQFATFSESSYLGNPGLCGRAVGRFCPSLSSPDETPIYKTNLRRPFFKKLLPLYIILASALVCCCFLGGLYAWSAIGGCSGLHGSAVSNDGDSYDNKEDLQFIHVTISSAIPSLNPKELALATDYYDANNIIGDGGFGLVYKAVLNNGTVVAVKKLVEDGVQGQSEFLAEMRTLGKIKHRHLVSLLGYCAYGNERILVYEYMKNGSLDTWLHCRDEGVASLDWRTRLKVVRGAAEGLAFLHHGSNPTIIHRDIKASNILLDCDFEARLADFGLARSTKAFESHVSTDFAGTAGYIPPEYSQAGAATTKGDVYSFGVVLLEILTGRRPTDPFFRKKEMSHVVTWILDISMEEAIEKTMDMSSSASTDEMLELMRIACMCCQETPSKRPNMREVVKLLDTLEKQQSPSRSPSIVLYDEAMSSPTCR